MCTYTKHFFLIIFLFLHGNNCKIISNRAPACGIISSNCVAPNILWFVIINICILYVYTCIYIMHGLDSFCAWLLLWKIKTMFSSLLKHYNFLDNFYIIILLSYKHNFYFLYSKTRCRFIRFILPKIFKLYFYNNNLSCFKC